MKSPPADVFVSTAQVAEALGVSVSTVKRWVDEGILPAQKTAGGHRKLLRSDVIAFARRGTIPTADLSRLTVPVSASEAISPEQLERPLLKAILAGDGEATRDFLVGAYLQGISLDVLADEIICPAMQQIGEEWAAGRIDVMEEHRASQLVWAALFEVKSLLEERAVVDRPTAVGGAPESDHTVLPSLLAQLVLLDAGWNVVNLGPNTPLSGFAKVIAEVQPRLMWLSLCHITVREPWITEYRDLYEFAAQHGCAIIVGGRELTSSESLRRKLPYTTFGDRMAHLAAFARTLHPRPARPRLGRPPGT